MVHFLFSVFPASIRLLAAIVVNYRMFLVRLIHFQVSAAAERRQRPKGSSEGGWHENEFEASVSALFGALEICPDVDTRAMAMQIYHSRIHCESES